MKTALLLTVLALLTACGPADDATSATDAGPSTPASSAAGASPSPEAAPADEPPAATHDRLVDAPLPAWKVELLELAFDAASAFPLKPHIKDRSRAQDLLVSACLQLDQPARALDWARRIANWRAGSGLADVVLHQVRAGADADALLPLIDEAAAVADQAADPVQGWRRDTVRSKLAAACLLLDLDQRSAAFQKDLEPSEAWRVGRVQMELVPETGLDGQLALLEHSIEVGDLAQMQTATRTLARLYPRLFDHADLLARAEAALDQALQDLPVAMQMPILDELVDTCLEHGRDARASELAEHAAAQVFGTGWRPEDRVPLLAQVASLSRRVGDEDGARELLDSAVKTYDAEKDPLIIDMFRAEALRPVILGYHELGDRARALELLHVLLDDAGHNPNARPRCDDLVETCADLVLADLEPDAALRTRLDELRAGLVAPW